MLQIELLVDKGGYRGLEDLLAIYCKSLDYDFQLDAYIFEIQNHLFFNLLFVLQNHVNNKDNWVGEDYWEEIKLVVDFKSEHSVCVAIYDFYRE